MVKNNEKIKIFCRSWFYVLFCFLHATFTIVNKEMRYITEKLFRVEKQ